MSEKRSKEISCPLSGSGRRKKGEKSSFRGQGQTEPEPNDRKNWKTGKYRSFPMIFSPTFGNFSGAQGIFFLGAWGIFFLGWARFFWVRLGFSFRDWARQSDRHFSGKNRRPKISCTVSLFLSVSLFIFSQISQIAFSFLCIFRDLCFSVLAKFQKFQKFENWAAITPNFGQISRLGPHRGKKTPKLFLMRCQICKDRSFLSLLGDIFSGLEFLGFEISRKFLWNFSRHLRNFSDFGFFDFSQISFSFFFIFRDLYFQFLAKFQKSQKSQKFQKSEKSRNFQKSCRRFFTSRTTPY